MFKQYFHLFFRRIFRNKTHFITTISGMVLAITALVLAFTLIRDERGFDSQVEQADHVFRVNKWYTDPSGDRQKVAETPGLMAAQLLQDMPEIVSCTRIAPWFDDVLLSYHNKNISTSRWLFADSNFLSFFHFHLRQGKNADEILKAPGQMLITPAIARALFGEADPIGQIVKGVSDEPFVVAGIIDQAPRQSHIQYDVVVSYSSTSAAGLDFSFMNNWLGQTVYTYVRLQSPGQASAVDKKLAAFTAAYMPNRTDMYDFYLQPFSEIYLNSSDILYLRGGKYGSSSFLRTFSIISLLILLIACFNYINIVTAQSLQRAREVGVKKVLGAAKRQLLAQFLTETLGMMIMATLMALVLARVLLPQLNAWFEKDIPLNAVFEWHTLALLFMSVLLVSLAAGLLPAVILSGFSPIQMIRKKFRYSPGSEWSRRVLVTAQLTISLGLIAGGWLLNRQFIYLMNKDLGFKKGQILTMKAPPGIRDHADAFRQDVQSLPGVESISICQAQMPEGTFTSTVIPEGSNGREVPVREFRVDTSYIRTYGLRLAAGRDFLGAGDMGGGSLIINEAMAREMQWKQPVGKRIRFGSDSTLYPVIGVLADFNFNSLHEAVTPLVMYLNARHNNVSIRFNPMHTKTLVSRLEQVWNKYEARYPFSYRFLDEYFASQYGKEKQLTAIISLFTVIAIIIACLGIYGLATFSIARRTQEIGIRKVLGATVPGIVFLLMRQFLKPLIIAFAIAAPVSWFLANRWLDHFAFHISPGAWMLIVPVLLLAIIVSLTVSIQSVRAALARPVKSLHTE